jgi:hypothetical protein
VRAHGLGNPDILELRLHKLFLQVTYNPSLSEMLTCDYYSLVHVQRTGLGRCVLGLSLCVLEEGHDW